MPNGSIEDYLKWLEQDVSNLGDDQAAIGQQVGAPLGQQVSAPEGGGWGASLARRPSFLTNSEAAFLI